MTPNLPFSSKDDMYLLLKDEENRHIALGSDAVARLKPKLMMYPEQCVNNWAALWKELIIFGFHECRFACLELCPQFNYAIDFVSLFLQEIADSNFR
jgi:hypothetical protein